MDNETRAALDRPSGTRRVLYVSPLLKGREAAQAVAEFKEMAVNERNHVGTGAESHAENSNG